jgi:hypothetical protein
VIDFRATLYNRPFHDDTFKLPVTNNTNMAVVRMCVKRHSVQGLDILYGVRSSGKKGVNF